MSIGEVSFFTGIVLFFIGIVGGGIDIKELKIPQLNGLTRFACFLGSIVFLILGMYLKNAISPSAIIAAINTPTTTASPASDATTTPPSSTPSETKPPVNPENPTATTPAPADAESKPAVPTEAELARDKAKKQFDDISKRLNAVWNAASDNVRNHLSPEQLQWLRKRESDCELQATKPENTDSIAQETAKYSCKTLMTEPRIDVLKQEIAAAINAEETAVYEETPSNPAINAESINTPTDNGQNKTEQPEPSNNQ